MFRFNSVGIGEVTERETGFYGNNRYAGKTRENESASERQYLNSCSQACHSVYREAMRLGT